RLETIGDRHHVVRLEILECGRQFDNPKASRLRLRRQGLAFDDVKDRSNRREPVLAHDVNSRTEPLEQSGTTDDELQLQIGPLLDRPEHVFDSPVIRAARDDNTDLPHAKSSSRRKSQRALLQSSFRPTTSPNRSTGIPIPLGFLPSISSIAITWPTARSRFTARLRPKISRSLTTSEVSALPGS